MHRLNNLMAIAVTVAMIAGSTTATFAQEEAPDLSDIMDELTEVLDLTDDQVPQVEAALLSFMKDLAAISDQAEDAEPDPQKMIGDMKKVQAGYQDQLKKILSKDQYKAYEAHIDAVMQEIFEGIAALKIIDLQPVLGLSDDQAEALEPVMGTGIRGILGTLFEYGDKKMNTRTKLKMGKSLKKTSSTMNAGMQEIFTPEQWQQYQAMKEEQKS